MGKINVKRKNYFYFFDFRLLKKNHCPICGQKYSVKYLSYRVYQEHKNFTTSNSYTGAYYYCSKCNFFITYKNQKYLTKMQKESNSLILSKAKDKINVMKVQVKKVNDIYVLEK